MFLFAFLGGLTSLNHTKVKMIQQLNHTRSQNDPTAVEPSHITVPQKLSAVTICQRDFMCATPGELQHGPEAPASVQPPWFSDNKLLAITESNVKATQ